MLGKDYMLAIIIVNYDDNLWTDQNHEADLDLPPGWRTIRDSSGTYYWHVPTGTTQWQHPMYNSGISHSLSAHQEKKALRTSVSDASPVRALPGAPSKSDRRLSLPWPDDDLFHNINEPGCKSFVVHCLGWVEIPEEDLAPGKSSITVNNCIQQLAHTKCDSSDSSSNEGQNMMMILKKDTMSLVDPLDHSLIHSQPIINIRVWGVGCNNGRETLCNLRILRWITSRKLGKPCATKELIEGLLLENCTHVNKPGTPRKLGRQGESSESLLIISFNKAFNTSEPEILGISFNSAGKPYSDEFSRPELLDFAFVANDKDTCMLKCHVFRCDVPAKAIASALHDMCSKIMAEKAVANNTITRSVTLETISPEDLPVQVDILDTVRESIQKYEVLFLGSLPVSKPMGMDVLNDSIENITSTTLREHWTAAVIEVTDTTVAVHHREAHEEPIWQCQVRYVTFLGVGKDPHTFAIIVDVGKQCFQCLVFWCEPDAGHVSEAVQAACMVQYQKCVVASSSSRMKSRSGAGKSLMKIKRTASVDSPISPFSSSGHALQKNGATSKRRGVMAFFEAFKQKHVRQTP